MCVLHHFNMVQEFKVVIGFVLLAPSSYYSTAKEGLILMLMHPPAELTPQGPTSSSSSNSPCALPRPLCLLTFYFSETFKYVF